jgi:hypothetical protein
VRPNDDAWTWRKTPGVLILWGWGLGSTALAVRYFAYEELLRPSSIFAAVALMAGLGGLYLAGGVTFLAVRDSRRSKG